LITVNSNTRYFNVPGADLVFGVVADSDAERKYFQCPRYVGDNLDLAACFIRINYRDANGKTDFYLVDDMVIDGDNITFSWLLSPKVTEYRGQIKFVMCAVGPDLKLKWHTTQGTGQVMEGLEPDNSHIESQTADVVAQLIAMVEEQTTAVENTGADQVVAVKTAAQTAQDNAVAEIEAKRINALASIPADYTALSATVDALVREAAPGIVCHAEGEVITLNDASDQAFRGLRIFGKSTQDGVPTPENPVEIVSEGDNGGLTVTTHGKNLARKVVSTGQTSEYATALHVDFAIKPNTTYAVSFIGTSGSTLYVNESIITIPTHFDVQDGLTSVIFTTKAKIPQDQYIESYGGWRLFKNYKDNSANKFDEFMLVEGTAAAQYEPFKGTTATITTVTADGKCNGLPGIPVTSGGNYTDADGQQWICDEVDFARGVYVKRIGPTILAGVAWMKNDSGKYFTTKNHGLYSNAHRVVCTHIKGGIPSDSNKENVIFINANNDIRLNITLDDDTVEAVTKAMDGAIVMGVLATPVETALSETKLAAYRALHTNKPNTTILNDSGAYMSVDYTADTKLYIDNKIKEALKC
jgi:hypothetical protein